jgi:hypothetical protein
MTMRTSHLSAVACCIAATLISSTAGAATTPKPLFVHRLETLCVVEVRSEARVKQPTFNPLKATAAEMPAAARYLGTLAPIVGRFSTNTRHLGTPTTGAATYTKLISAWAGLARTLTLGASAAANGNVVGFRRAVAASFTESAHADALAKTFGATRCAG